MNNQDLFQFEEVQQERNPHIVPWLVTAAVSVIALLVSFLVVAGVKSSKEEPSEAASTEVEEVEEPELVVPEPVEEEEEAPVEEPVDPNRPDDSIDVSSNIIGDTFRVDVQDWGMSFDASTKLGSVRYTIPDGSKLVLSSDLIDSLPAGCDRDSWGVEKVDDDKVTYLSPQKMCTENESLYIEILAIVKHLAETQKPL